MFAPSLINLDRRSLAPKRAHSASGEDAVPKRSFFGESAYEDIVNTVAAQFVTLIQTCEDTHQRSYNYRFDGNRHVDERGRQWAGSYYLRLNATLVQADAYAPTTEGQLLRKRRFRLSMQLFDQNWTMIPIHQQLLDRGLPTNVFIICGMQREQLVRELMEVLNPWLTFLHLNYGLSRMPRNTNLL